MGIRFRFSTRGEKPYRVSGAFGIFLQKFASVRLPQLSESISVDMFKSEYLPYEASETYRRILTEYECKCARTMVETQRQLLRGV